MEQNPFLKETKSQIQSNVAANPKWNWANKHELTNISDKTSHIMRDSPEMMINCLFPKQNIRLKIDESGRNNINYFRKEVSQDGVFRFLSIRRKFRF